MSKDRLELVKSILLGIGTIPFCLASGFAASSWLRNYDLYHRERVFFTEHSEEFQSSLAFIQKNECGNPICDVVVPADVSPSSEIIDAQICREDSRLRFVVIRESNSSYLYTYLPIESLNDSFPPQNHIASVTHGCSNYVNCMTRLDENWYMCRISN